MTFGMIQRMEECDWYKMHLFEMYKTLKPNQRREVLIEVNRQRRIEELEAELRNALKKVSVWKATLCVFAVVVYLVFALK